MHFVMCLLLCAAFAGCGKKAEMQETLCHIVLEAGEGFTVEKPARAAERGSDVSFRLTLMEGYRFEGVDYAGADSRTAENTDAYAVRYDGSGETLTVTLHDVRYSESVTVAVQKSDCRITYYGCGGRAVDKDMDAKEGIAVRVRASHLRPNTAAHGELFVREGYTQTGWNTREDGSGVQVGAGSRIDWEEGLRLYARWVPWSSEEWFQYEVNAGKAVITAYLGDEETVCVPAELGGYPVYRIGEAAFEGASCKTVILPDSLYEVEKWAFRDAALAELYFCDSVQKISDYAFEGCSDFRTLHIDAAEKPVYSGNYFDTFQDKYDRLQSFRDKKKIVLFSGSSTRFGYDSALIAEAFPEYEVVNMGVFAYTPALPQLLLILECMQEGDILIDSPEFDASARQFCRQRELDYAFFAMMESNYDVISRLDIREFSQVFTAYTSYSEGRSGMEKKSYDLCAADFDEDGNAVVTPSYNVYGDYALYRPDSGDEQPVFGLPVHYTVNAFPKEQYLVPFNRMLQKFLDRGVQVFFTYAPRNRYAVSADSTKEERARLDVYFRENLIVPVLGDLEDSLYSGIYLYGTDNHLSTAGAKMRTENVIRELKAYLEGRNEP